MVLARVAEAQVVTHKPSVAIQLPKRRPGGSNVWEVDERTILAGILVRIRKNIAGGGAHARPGAGSPVSSALPAPCDAPVPGENQEPRAITPKSRGRDHEITHRGAPMKNRGMTTKITSAIGT